MTRPDPLTPPGCSMAGNDWYPLYFDRLRKSKWWRRASDTARARNVMMWGEAFKAVPAGSLPDDDDELAEAAGYGLDVDTFAAFKSEIMAPWVLCSDGRWYHPTVSEAALDAWERQSEKRRKASVKKAEQRARARGETPPKTPVVPTETENVPGDTSKKDGDIRHNTDSTGQTGQDRKEADASLSLGIEEIEPEKPPSKASGYPAAFEADWTTYPHFPGRSSKKATHGAWRRLTPARRQALPSAIARYAREGREPKAECGAPAMERWLARELDLNWHGPAEIGAAQPTAPTFPGPADLRAALVAAHPEGEAFARKYVDPSGWQEVPYLAILVRNTFAADQFKGRPAKVLAHFGVAIAVQASGAAA